MRYLEAMKPLSQRPGFWILTFACLALILTSAASIAIRMRESYPPLALESLKNASYIVDGDTITLQDGKREFGSIDTSNYINVELAEWAFGDLDGDGNQDAVVALASNGGGSGTFLYLVPVINTKGNASSLNPGFDVGDRIEFRSISISNKMVSADYLTQGPNDPRCCPTVLTTIHLKLIGNALTCADRACQDAHPSAR